MTVAEREGAGANPSERPDRAELVKRAQRLQPLLREHASKAEVDSKVADEVNAALVEAGFFRLLVPRRFGGYESDQATLLEIVETLAEADGSAAWLVAIGTTATWLAGLFPEQSLQEMLGASPDLRLAGASGGPHVAKPAPGGLRLSGRWTYLSGVDSAAWVLLGSPVVDDSGETVSAVLTLVPTSEVTIERTWQTIGMRGTGSDTVVVDNIFVPEHRTLCTEALDNGIPTELSADVPMYKMPLAPVGTLPLFGTILGLGTAALKLVIEKAPTKAMVHTFFARQSDSVGVQIQIGQAAMKLKVARTLAYDIAAKLDKVTAGESPVLDHDARAELRAQVCHAAQEAVEAIQILLNAHGAGAFAESNRLQQYWRDANTAARHAALNAFVAYEVHGKALLGVEERISAST
ncbi:oxidoreductase [Saccharopolyspora sp. K220]|uniref:acyl-CoA dehydrogenase family protein n=1 Tax=Saccharopolyspora soli TaxID=2926618 RepID=UPI001F5A0C4D|nr:acyl-CoA dehydrogenase family protein [Saccharopolyspora soli]MCI2422957.1 oxidoreductase [Saccharopolyspora soli]